MSLRIAPATSHATHTDNTVGRHHNGLQAPHPSKGAPSAPGLPDTLRNNLTAQAPRGSPSLNASTIPTSAHPLEARLLAWRSTQEALKMESLRRAYGMAEPIRRGMEMKIVQDSSFVPLALGGPRGNVHQDILALGGRDAEVSWEDVFHNDEFREPPAFHDEMEKRLKMDW
ncbi:putative 20S proteasome maturation protein Ump1 [Talaromyces proteolyticus]|uniref:20S proteasome maturation protein Ump1 n=1 Tax=Talaromyces proteolyticus TaxID=1131652 RepID=A0AAD4PX91_9EURO|nr:putative 20S proteasome maturation protein Ump1 [Talaromyces proteolyticus]KAH8696139.1 putative 20S proteasome maturation protein Ump1 [Talaromyces proteolyticus]